MSNMICLAAAMVRAWAPADKTPGPAAEDDLTTSGGSVVPDAADVEAVECAGDEGGEEDSMSSSSSSLLTTIAALLSSSAASIADFCGGATSFASEVTMVCPAETGVKFSVTGVAAVVDMLVQ